MEIYIYPLERLDIDLFYRIFRICSELRYRISDASEIEVPLIEESAIFCLLCIEVDIFIILIGFGCAFAREDIAHIF